MTGEGVDFRGVDLLLSETHALGQWFQWRPAPATLATVVVASYRLVGGATTRRRPNHAAAAVVTMPPMVMAQATPKCSDTQPI